MRSLLVSWVAASCAAGCATAEPPSTETESAIRSATRQWATAFNTCTSPDAVAALYDPGAQLWGTVSPTLVTTPEGARQYFSAPCTATPKPTVELGAFSVRSYGDTAISSGAYTFTLYPGGQARSVPARFSLTFRRSGAQWLIVSHHSSPQPMPPSAAASPPRP